MAQIQTQTMALPLKPGEIVSFGDRIVWVNVIPRGSELGCIVYIAEPLSRDGVEYIKNTRSGTALALIGKLTHCGVIDRILRKKVKPFDIRLAKVIMWVSHDYEVYEMKIPVWRRILAIFKPIRIYGYRWSVKDEKIEMIVVEFRGLSLKPRIVEKKWL